MLMHSLTPITLTHSYRDFLFGQLQLLSLSEDWQDHHDGTAGIIITFGLKLQACMLFPM